MTGVRGTKDGDIWLAELECWAEWMLAQMPFMSRQQRIEAWKVLRDVQIAVMNGEEK